MKKVALISFLCLLGLVCNSFMQAQTGIARLEFPAELEKNPYEVVPLEKEGLLMIYAQPELLGELDRSWHFTLYDTNLRIRWETDVPVLDGARFMASHLEDSTLYLFFFDPGRIKQGDNNYQVSALGFKTGFIDHFKGYLPEVEEPKGFLVSQGKVLVACHLQKERVALFILDLVHQSQQAFVADVPDQNFVEDLQPDPFSGSVLMVMSNYLSRKQNRLMLLQISLEAELINSITVEPVLPSKYLNSARVFAYAPSVYMVIGTYSNLASKIPGSNDYYGLESAGFFVTRFEEGEQQFMNYYNLLEFENLRPSMSAREYVKLTKRKSKDQKEYSADYELTLHPVTRNREQFVLMAEAFYPDFRTVSDISYDYWGRPITHTYSVFEGYRIFQGILMGFSSQGELMWDNSIELSNINTLDLSARAGYFFDGKPAVIYFSDGKKISFQAFAGNALLEGVTFTDLDTSHRGDKVIELGDNFMKPWYGNYFLCYGNHTIRNNLMPENEKRTVYYINKVVFE